MRLGLAALMMYVGAINIANAEVFNIATAETVETRAIAKIIKEAYRLLGHEANVAYRHAAGSMKEVNAGKFDAELARISGIEMEFPNLVRVAEPIYSMSISAIVRSGSNVNIGSWEEIGDRRIGYPRGYKILDIRTRKLDAVKVSSPTAIVKMVKAGRLEVGLLMQSDAEALAKKYGGVSVLEPPIEVVTLYHYLHVRHRRLAPSLEKVLIQLNDSGRSKEILSGQ